MDIATETTLQAAAQNNLAASTQVLAQANITKLLVEEGGGGSEAVTEYLPAWEGSTGTSLSIPSAVSKIAPYCFYNNNNLRDIVIPSNVTSIGDYAFYGTLQKLWSMPSTLVFEEGCETIGSNAFYGCTGLEALVLPDSLTTLGVRAFNNCTKLKSLTIGNGLAVVDQYTFNNCTALSTLVIGRGIKKFNISAFYGLPSTCYVEINTRSTVFDSTGAGTSSVNVTLKNAGFKAGTQVHFIDTVLTIY